MMIQRFLLYPQPKWRAVNVDILAKDAVVNFLSATFLFDYKFLIVYHKIGIDIK